MVDRDQACIHINPSDILGASLLQCGLIILPLVPKTNSEATIVTGIDMISRAIFLKVRYLIHAYSH
jgi:hypothetical protein